MLLRTGLLAGLAVLGGTCAAASAVAPTLGAAANFAVLSAARGGTGAVTCTNSSISADVGSSGLATSVTQTGCAIAGSIVAPVSTQVLADFSAAYDRYATIPCTASLNAAYTNAAFTLAPGVYCSAAAVTFTDTILTLDAQGDANAVWIFKIGTGGTGALTGTNLSVVLAGSGQPCNVSWWVAEAVTTTASAFQGNILAGAAITMTGVAGSTTSFNGDALAKGSVTLTGVTLSACRGAAGAGNQHGHHGQCGHGGHKGSDDCDRGNSKHRKCHEDTRKDREECDRDDDEGKSGMSPFGHHRGHEHDGGRAYPGRKDGHKK
jgi:hypothetical protein